MNVNVKLSFTDEQLNNIKRHITGKQLKAKATRAEICELVKDLLEPFTDIYVHVERKPTADLFDQVAEEEPASEMIIDDDAHPDCCRANELLLQRINRLQHKLDTRTSL